MTPPAVAAGSGASASAVPIPETGSGASAAAVPQVNVAPGSKAPITVTGTLSPDAAGLYYYTPQEGADVWSTDPDGIPTDGFMIAYFDGISSWAITEFIIGIPTNDYWSAAGSSSDDHPADLSFSAVGSATGTPTVSGGEPLAAPPTVAGADGASASAPPNITPGSASPATPPTIAGADGASAVTPPTVAGGSGASASAVPIPDAGSGASAVTPPNPRRVLYLSGSTYLPSPVVVPAPTLIDDAQVWTNTGEDLPAYPRTRIYYDEGDDQWYLEVTLSDVIEYTWEGSSGTSPDLAGPFTPFDGDPGLPVGDVDVELSQSVLEAPATVAGADGASASTPPNITPGSASPATPPSVAGAAGASASAPPNITPGSASPATPPAIAASASPSPATPGTITAET